MMAPAIQRELETDARRAAKVFVSKSNQRTLRRPRRSTRVQEQQRQLATTASQHQECRGGCISRKSGKSRRDGLGSRPLQHMTAGKPSLVIFSASIPLPRAQN